MGDHGEDLALVRGVLANERKALEVFVQRMRCVGSILKVRNARLDRPLDAAALDDLVQDTLVVIWRKLHTYAGRGALEGWAYQVCSFELLSALREQRRHPRNESDLDGDTALTSLVMDPPPGELEEGSSKKLLRHLADREAEIVRLRHYDDLSFGEIAVLLRVTVSAVKTHYYRGVQKLRDILSLEKKGMSA